MHTIQQLHHRQCLASHSNKTPNLQNCIHQPPDLRNRETEHNCDRLREWCPSIPHCLVRKHPDPLPTNPTMLDRRIHGQGQPGPVDL